MRDDEWEMTDMYKKNINSYSRARVWFILPRKMIIIVSSIYIESAISELACASPTSSRAFSSCLSFSPELDMSQGVKCGWMMWWRFWYVESAIWARRAWTMSQLSIYVWSRIWIGEGVCDIWSFWTDIKSLLFIYVDHS